MTWRNDETMGGLEGCFAAIRAADPNFGKCAVRHLPITCYVFINVTKQLDMQATVEPDRQQIKKKSSHSMFKVRDRKYSI